MAVRLSSLQVILKIAFVCVLRSNARVDMERLFVFKYIR